MNYTIFGEGMVGGEGERESLFLHERVSSFRRGYEREREREALHEYMVVVFLIGEVEMKLA